MLIKHGDGKIEKLIVSSDEKVDDKKTSEYLERAKSEQEKKKQEN